MVLAASAGLEDGAPAIGKTVEVMHGEQRCTLFLVEGADSSALVFALNSRLDLGGAAFHLTVPGSDSVVPLTAALPGGLTLALHLRGGLPTLETLPQWEPRYFHDEAVAPQAARPDFRPGIFGTDDGGMPSFGPPRLWEPLDGGASAADAAALDRAEPFLAAWASTSAGDANALEHSETLLSRPASEDSFRMQVEHVTERRPQRRRLTSNTWSRASPRSYSASADEEGQGVSPQGTWSLPDLQGESFTPQLQPAFPSFGADTLHEMDPHATSFTEAAWQEIAAGHQETAENLVAATEGVFRFGRLSTDLSNERTLLAWIRTAMAAMRTAFGFISIGAADSGILWSSSVWFARSAMVTAIFVATLTGIRRYKVIKQVTFMDVPPRLFGRLSVFWFNYLIVVCAVVMMAGLYMDTWHKT